MTQSCASLLHLYYFHGQVNTELTLVSLVYQTVDLGNNHSIECGNKLQLAKKFILNLFNFSKKAEERVQRVCVYCNINYLIVAFSSAFVPLRASTSAGLLCSSETLHGYTIN